VCYAPPRQGDLRNTVLQQYYVCNPIDPQLFGARDKEGQDLILARYYPILTILSYIIFDFTSITNGNLILFKLYLA
jgi:hypothetical protein